ncbi:MAG: SCO family protein [Rhodospirillales bacterium]
MKFLATFVFALSIAVSGVAQAHSMKNLEEQLYDKERYFQRIDKVAPAFSLQGFDGENVTLEQLRGNVLVLHFIYTNCPDVCPLHAEKLAEIQQMVNQTPMRDRVRFVTITTDPKNDTPAVMREYGLDRGLDPSNWLGLTTGPDRLSETRELVEKFGHKFTEEGDGYLVHSVVTHVIDKEGRWRANFHGLKFDSTNLLVFVNALVNDEHGAESAEGDGFWNTVREWLQ